jgi:hypothetical protein
VILVQKHNTKREKCKNTKSTRTHDEKLGPNKTQVKHQLKKFEGLYSILM